MVPNNHLNGIANMKLLIAAILVLVSGSAQAQMSKSGDLKQTLVTCSKGSDVDRIDCYEAVIDAAIIAYKKSPYNAEFNGEQEISGAKNGAQMMCRLGSAFLPSQVSGSDQCLL
jgi:hypothetical protein